MVKLTNKSDSPLCESSRVVSGRSGGKLLNGLNLLLCRFAISANSTNCVNRHLSRQPRMRSRFLVNQGLNSNLIRQLFGCMGVHVLTAFCKGSQYRIQLFNLLLRYFQFARDCKNLGHFQPVKFCCCSCSVLAAFGVSNPSICRAFLPTLTFQVECGTPAVLVEGSHLERMNETGIKGNRLQPY